MRSGVDAMTFEEFWGWVNFPLGLLVAEYIVAMRLPRRKYFPLLLAAGCVPSLVLSMTWKYVVIEGVWGAPLVFLGEFLLSLVMPIAAFRADVWSYIFVGIMAYCMQHIAYQVNGIILILSGGIPLWAQVVLQIAISAVLYTVLYFIFTRRRKAGELISVYNVPLLAVSGITLLVTIIMSFFGGIYAGASGNKVLSVIISAFAIIACLFSIFMEFSITAIKTSQTELVFLKHILYESQKQYKESRESIDIINVKCHDLKHRLYGLEGRLDEREISQISQAISIYDNTFETGNAALDTVLTEKGLICGGKGIRFTCMIDGSSLSKMRQSDIYSLFGNALDNAIEGVSGEEESNRVISIREAKRSGFSVITIENYHTDEIEFKDGLPVTGKDDKDFHGFGMKSMRMVVEQYGGELIVSFADNIFKVQIVLLHD